MEELGHRSVTHRVTCGSGDSLASFSPPCLCYRAPNVVAVNSHESPPNSGAFSGCVVAPPRGQAVVVTVAQASLEKRVMT